MGTNMNDGKQVVLTSKRTRWEWAEEITTAWQNTVIEIIKAGRLLVEAKTDLNHGEFILMVEGDLPFGRITAFRLMAIAGHQFLANVTHVQHLPASWGTLYELTKLPEPFLKARIEAGELTPELTRREATMWRRLLVAESAADAPPLPTDKYRVIYADPPWAYSNVRFGGTTEPGDHYPVMKPSDIALMPIRELALDDSVLFLWTTSPLLEETFDVIKGWGFKYKTSFIWDKVKHNMGHYSSVRHEFLLVCTRGS